MELKHATIQYGQVRFHSKVEAIPAKSEAVENTTIHTNAVAGSPEHFEVSFFIQCEFKEEGLEPSRTAFHWNVLVSGFGPDARYSQIEGAATRKIVPMLQQVAKWLESDSAGST